MNILAVGAHPDDVETMCAGTLAKYAAQGHKVFIATATNGNIGSARVIEKNGGVLLDKLDDVIDGRPRVTGRYRIEL